MVMVDRGNGKFRLEHIIGGGVVPPLQRPDGLTLKPETLQAQIRADVSSRILDVPSAVNSANLFTGIEDQKDCRLLQANATQCIFNPNETIIKKDSPNGFVFIATEDMELEGSNGTRKFPISLKRGEVLGQFRFLEIESLISVSVPQGVKSYTMVSVTPVFEQLSEKSRILVMRNAIKASNYLEGINTELHKQETTSELQKAEISEIFENVSLDPTLTKIQVFEASETIILEANQYAVVLEKVDEQGKLSSPIGIFLEESPNKPVAIIHKGNPFGERNAVGIAPNNLIMKPIGGPSKVLLITLNPSNEAQHKLLCRLLAQKISVAGDCLK